MKIVKGQIINIEGRKFFVIDVDAENHSYSKVSDRPRISSLVLTEVVE